MDISNSSFNSSLILDDSLVADYMLMFFRQINMYSTILIMFIGLIGHLLTILVYSKQKFRTNSNHIYLLWLALNHILFLFVHFFEDTIRSYQDIYSNEFLSSFNFMKSINIIDNYETSCILINYFRYVLRFNSAYITVSFTIQRLAAVISPVYVRNKISPISVVATITILSLILNIWVFFFFKLQDENKVNKNCDVDKSFGTIYFKITIFYIIILIWIPVLVIFVSNSYVLNKTKLFNNKNKNFKFKYTIDSIFKAKKSETAVINLKKKIQNSISENLHTTRKNSRKSNKKRENLSVYSDKEKQDLVIHQISSVVRNSHIENSKRITKLLVLISFSYAVLHLPYLFTWSIFYYRIAFKTIFQSTSNYLFAALQVAEIFYILSYSLNFYIYIMAGSLFRKQVKKISMFFFWYYCGSYRLCKLKEYCSGSLRSICETRASAFI